MKQSGHLNPSEETGTGCPVTSTYGRTPPNKHGGVARPQQQVGVGEGRRPSHYFSDTELHSSRASVALIARSSTGDVASTNGTGYFVTGPGFGCASSDICRSRCMFWSIFAAAFWCCCCLPTPLTLASGASPIFSLVVHQLTSLASSAVTSVGSVHKSRGDNVGAVEDMICVVYVSVTKGA